MTEIETASERGNTSGGGGEEEAGEPDVGLDPITPDHALSGRQMLNRCATQAPPPLFFLKILFIYSTEIVTASERGNTSSGSGRGRSRVIAEEPDVGLNPITPGSRPEPKADA